MGWLKIVSVVKKLFVIYRFKMSKYKLIIDEITIKKINYILKAHPINNYLLINQWINLKKALLYYIMNTPTLLKWLLSFS